MTQTFPYQDLHFEDSIRLLHLLPGEDNESISCSISHHHLGDQPNYVAISYSWLDDANSEPRSIECGEHKMLVQNTIFQLLKRLRGEDSPVSLWIDAICINQAETRERDSQVEMMGRIYSSASLVVAWVGEEDNRTARLAQFLDNMVERVQSKYMLDVNKLWRMDVEWTDLAIFLQRPWFTRTWVLQEVCLAKRCVLRCGPYSWPWDALETISENLAIEESIEVPGAVRRLNQSVMEFSRHWRAAQKARCRVGLAELLGAVSGTFSSLAVDKIYGILSLADERLGIRVRYDKDVQEVFIDVAKTLLENGALDVLAAASDNIWNETPGIPSWVPDWACVEKPTSLARAWQGYVPFPSQVVERERLAAPVARPDLKAGLLHLGVVLIDCVCAVGVPWPGNGHERDSIIPEDPLWDIGPSAANRLEQWHSMVPRYMKGNPSCYAPTGEDCISAFMQTITVYSVSLPEGFSTWTAAYLAFKDRLGWLQRLNVSRFHSAFRKQKDPMVFLHGAVKMYCHKRNLFFTKNGYMGLGPFNILPFDRIVAVPGLQSPFVLRKTRRGRYKMIGECYLHRWERAVDICQFAEMVAFE